MHNNLVNFFKKVSFFSTDVDRDWRVMFSILVLTLVVLLGWNVYFFQEVSSEITTSDTIRSKGTMSVANEQEDLLKKTIATFDVKAVENRGIISGNVHNSLFNTPDPAR